MIAVRPFPIHAKQADFRQSDAWLRGFCAGRGCGKTMAGAIDTVFRSRPGDEMIAVSPTHNDALTVTMPAVEQVTRRVGLYLRKRESSPHRIWYRTRDGEGTAVITFYSGDKPEVLRGPSAALAWLDEGSRMTKEVYDLVLGCLRFQGRLGKLTVTFTPKGRKHWTFNRFFEQEENERGELVYVPIAGTHLVQAHSSENPFMHEGFVPQMRSQLTSIMAEQELGGQYVEFEGAMFRYEWFHQIDQVPADCSRVRYWDNAATEDAGCFTAGVLMARSADGNVYVEDVVRGQWSYLKRNEMMLETAEKDARKYRNSVQIVFEREGGSAGPEVANRLIRMLCKYPVKQDHVRGQKSRMVDKEQLPGGAKQLRAVPFASQCEGGNVYIAQREWTPAYLEELTMFPESKFCDQVDATSGAYKYLVDAYRPEESVTSIPRPQLDSRRHGVLISRKGRR